MPHGTDHQLLIHWTPKATASGSAEARIMNHDEPQPSPAVFHVPPSGHHPSQLSTQPNNPQRQRDERSPATQPTFSHTLTLRSTYRSSSTTLASTAFFGASLSYSAVFTYLSTSPAVLSWAASLFLVGAVAAGGMSVMSSVDSVWPVEPTKNGCQPLSSSSTSPKSQSDQEKGVASSSPDEDVFRQNKLIMASGGDVRSLRIVVVRIYGYLSVIFVLVGLLCLNVTVILGALDEDAGHGGHRDEVAEYTPAIVVAAGVFGIVGSVTLAAGAVIIRERYFADYGRQHFLIDSMPTEPLGDDG